MLQTLGKFVQDSLQTNTATELANDVSDIYYDYKRPRAIWCLSMSVIVGAGVTALFVAESATYGYFGPIVEEALPFLGTIGTKIAVGTIGFWFGGALGHNGAKFTSQAFYDKQANVTNSAFVVTDADVERIIDANPQHYTQADDLEAAPPSREQQIAELKSQLSWLITKVSEHKEDGTDAKATYKMPLLSALRFSNLKPLIELFPKNDAKRETRKDLIKRDAEYACEGGAAFVANGSAVVPRESIRDSDDDTESVAPMGLAAAPAPPPLIPRANVVFKHMERQANTKFYPLRQDTANKGTTPVADTKRMQVVMNLRQQYLQEEQAQQAERQIAGSFRRYYR